MSRLKLLPFVPPTSSELNFWPGDEILGHDEDSNERGSSRSKKVTQFVRDPDFDISIAVVCVSSLPRWHFCLCLEPIKQKDGQYEAGILKAMRALISDSNDILRESNVLPNRIISGSKRREELRIRIFRSMGATIAYLVEKYRPYCSDMWRILHGQKDAATVTNIINSSDCFSHSGLDAKIVTAFDGLLGHSYDQAVLSAIRMLKAIRKVFLGKGNSDNDLCGKLFSRVRNLGLVTPFLPCLTSTIDRELCNKFLLVEHTAYIDKLVKTVFCPKKNLKEAASGKTRLYN